MRMHTWFKSKSTYYALWCKKMWDKIYWREKKSKIFVSIEIIIEIQCVVRHLVCIIALLARITYLYFSFPWKIAEATRKVKNSKDERVSDGMCMCICTVQTICSWEEFAVHESL